MTDSERIEQLESKVDALTKLNKDMFKLLKNIGKALHLLPVTEKEEKALQIMQRKNINQAAKVNEDLNAMENKSEDTNALGNLFSSIGTIYGDVLAEDVLGGEF